MSGAYYTIVNRAAAGGRCAKLASGALDGLRQRGLSLEVAFTEHPKHAVELAERAAEAGRRRFLSLGGDGTAAELVNGLIGAGVSESCELGMLPLGTGNSFLRDFGITDVETACDRIARGQSAPIDVLRLRHSEGVIHFINTVGTGFVPRAGALRNERFSRLGAAGYIAAVFVCVAKLEYEHCSLEYGGRLDEASTVLSSFSNSQYTGGSMRMAPDAKVADGLLDVVRAGPLGRAALLSAFGRIYSGTHTDLDEVWTEQVERVDFVNPSKQAVLVDGDLYELAPLSIDVLPSAIRLVS